MQQKSPPYGLLFAKMSVNSPETNGGLLSDNPPSGKGHRQRVFLPLFDKSKIIRSLFSISLKIFTPFLEKSKIIRPSPEDVSENFHPFAMHPKIVVPRTKI